MSAPPASSKPRVLVVGGATASGKTEVALALARALGGELVSADSVQVYRGFDIGSAKLRGAACAGIRQHLVDVREPDEPLDAQGYAALAAAAIEDVASRGALPIVVGGTGLWVRALLRGLLPAPPADPALRARLRAEIERHGAPALHARLAAVDARAAARIHPNDAVRIVRALEVFEQTGQPIGALRAAHALGAPRYDAAYVVLERAAADLADRIAARTSAMMREGLLEEVRGLRARYGDRARALGAVGYREVVSFLEGAIRLEDLEPAIVRATRAYARRQRVWLQSDPDVTRRASPEDVRALLRHLEAIPDPPGSAGEPAPARSRSASPDRRSAAWAWAHASRPAGPGRDDFQGP